ncbi:MAG: hypothetical protein WA323_22060 [Candidatus Nitrosopolaris sp.]|jgi:hypothetical protein
MSTHATFFKQSLFVLSKNPILFLLPFAGSALSIIVEVIFTGELYYSNGNKVFFPNIILFGIFFAAFMITYFQLGLSRKSVSLGGLNHSVGVLELLAIYAIYSLVLYFIGSYEGQIREAYSLRSDSFSMYTFKITTYHDIINIIPPGVVIVILSTLTSFLFSAWMVQYVINEHDIRYGLVESFRKLTHDIVFKDTRKKMLLLFLVTLVISILDFVLTNIAIIRISNVLQLYLYQFMILSIVDSLYAPFFLVCLFFIALSRSFTYE